MHKANDLAGRVALKLEFFRFAAVVANPAEYVPSFGLKNHDLVGRICTRQDEVRQTTSPRTMTDSEAQG